MGVCKDDLFKEAAENKFAKELFNFIEFKDDNILFTNKSNKNNNQRNIIIIANSTLQNEENFIKRGVLGW